MPDADADADAGTDPIRDVTVMRVCHLALHLGRGDEAPGPSSLVTPPFAQSCPPRVSWISGQVVMDGLVLRWCMHIPLPWNGAG